MESKVQNFSEYSNKSKEIEGVYPASLLRGKFFSIHTKMINQGKFPYLFKNGMLVKLNITYSTSYPETQERVYFLHPKSAEYFNELKNGYNHLARIFNNTFEQNIYSLASGDAEEFKKGDIVLKSFFGVSEKLQKLAKENGIEI